MTKWDERMFRWALALVILVAIATPSRAQDHGHGKAPRADRVQKLLGRDNLIAWCIVPFDSKKREPEPRAAMLETLGFKHFAYDWRAEHVPTFDAEIASLRKHHVGLDAFWCPGELNRDSQAILDALKRNGVKTQLWVLLGSGDVKVADAADQERRVADAVRRLKPLAGDAGKIGCSLALYNHGGWFGEPENQIEIVERLKAQGIKNVGIVYNLHHGHDHLDRFPALLRKMKPYLVALNLNGMDTKGDRVGRKILPLGQGEHDLALLRIILDSGYDGPIGILGHTQDDAEERLKDNLDGLDWLVPQLEGKPAGAPPKPRTPVPPRPTPKAATNLSKDEAAQVAALLLGAKEHGDPRRGAVVFASVKTACLSCHKIGNQGGAIGPELSNLSRELAPEDIAASVLWPRKEVKKGYSAITVELRDGRVIQGYPVLDDGNRLILTIPNSPRPERLGAGEIESRRVDGTLMPENLLAALSETDRRDLMRFLLDLGKPESAPAVAMLEHAHAPVDFAYDRAPLHPQDWPSWKSTVNRDRIYDFYAKEAEHFSKLGHVPPLLPPFPGLDGGKQGHWGNQNEDTWVDGRWNDMDLGTLMSGVFRGAGVTVNKGICIRLGEHGEMSTCFNPETLRYEAAWTGGFVKFSSVRHGFMDGLIMVGTPTPLPAQSTVAKPARYKGLYRHEERVIFAYESAGVEYLDAPWFEGGKFTRVVGPAKDHPLRDWTKGGKPQWPRAIPTGGTVNSTSNNAYVVDTIRVPFQNPWKAPMFIGDHDFLPDGSALLCTMQGDVWHVTGLDDTLKNVTWRRFASGLHQPLGLMVVDGLAYVLGRDQITRLKDVDGDGEADAYECFSNAYETSPAGHDFICGLQRDANGRFYTASGKQGILRISEDGKTVDVIATGFRNPDGLGLSPEGLVTVPSSEGDWVSASMVSEIKEGSHYGYPGPKNGKTPELPMIYMPRGLDNSSGGQVWVTSDRFGPLKGQLLHLSFGAGTAYVLLRDRVDGQAQAAAVPLPVEFLSGAHRGRFSPKDGQLYVSGMAGWGSYTPDDGSFQRVRYTGKPATLPVSWHATENGMLITFSGPIDAAVVRRTGSLFAQCWNYRYGPQYGSPEFAPSHPGTPGHDPVPIRSAHVLADGRTLFVEMPDIQPVNQLHMRLKVDSGPAAELFATVHKLGAPFTGFEGFRPEPKILRAHPILADMAALNFKPIPNPHKKRLVGARRITIEAGKNLSYNLRSIKAKPGEAIALTFYNPDVVPHNWVLIRPGTLDAFGDLVNKIIAEPDAALRNYIPKSEDVIAYTDIVGPQDQFIISFQVPDKPGRYPYLCTFPGHWKVMNGELIVE